MGILDSVKSVKDKFGRGRNDDWDDDYDEYDDDYDDWDDGDDYDDYEEEERSSRVRTRDYDSDRDSSWQRDSTRGGGRSGRIDSFTPLVSDSDMRAQRSYESVSRRSEDSSRPDYESSLQMYKIEPRESVGRGSTHTEDALEAAREELSQLQKGIPVPLNSLNNTSGGSPRAAQPSTVSRRIVTITPTSYADAERVAEAFRNGSSAVVSFTAIKPDLAKRLLDFSFGVVSVSGGTVERIGEKVFFLSRGGVSITEAEKQQLRDTGIL